MPTLEPQRRVIWFGSGAEGRIVSERGGIVVDGVLYREFYIIPSEAMRIYYNIKDEDYVEFEGEYVLVRKFPEAMIKTICDHPAQPVTLVKCGWNYEATPFTVEDRNADMIINLQRQLEAYKLANAKLISDLMLALVKTKTLVKTAKEIVELAKPRQKPRTLEEEEVVAVGQSTGEGTE